MRWKRIAAMVGLVLVVGLISIVVWDRTAPACTVTVGEHTVDLDQGDAEAAAKTVATVVRRSGRVADVRQAVASSADLGPADARIVAAALSGRAHSALSCRHGGAGDSEPDTLSPAGLTARAERVRADMASRFGDLPLGGFAPGGVHSGHMPGSAHYEGRAIDVFFRPINAADKNRGWALAQYLVANADRLEINTVIFDGQIWTARRGFQGWRTYSVSHAGKSAATIAILEHHDHVHVDVAD
jgi:hypothetical protein